MKDLERSNYKMKSEILFLNSEISSLKKRMEYQKKLLRDNNYFIPTNDFVAKEDSSNNQIINNNQLTLPTINSEIRNY